MSHCHLNQPIALLTWYFDADVKDQGVENDSIFIFACLPSTTIDEQIVPGCSFKAIWPRGFGDVSINSDNCLVDAGSKWACIACNVLYR
jgi:hypothetical protein